MADLSKFIVKKGDIFLYKAMLTSFDEMSKAFEADGIMSKAKLTIKKGFISKYDVVEELRKTAMKPSEKLYTIQQGVVKTDSVPSSTTELPKTASPQAPTQNTQGALDASLDALMDPNTTPMSSLQKKGDKAAAANFKKIVDYLTSLSADEFKPPLTPAAKKGSIDVYNFPTNASKDGELIDPRRSGRVIELAPIGEIVPVTDTKAFQWFVLNGPKYGFIVYLDKGLYYIGQEDIKNQVQALGDDNAKQSTFKGIVEKFLSPGGQTSLDAMISNGSVDLAKALSDVQTYTLPPPTIEDCKGIDRTIWAGHKTPGNLGLISAEKTDFESLTRAIITIEGGYGAPVNFINLKAPDSAKGTPQNLLPGFEIMANSGETLWGIDRAAGAWETSGGAKRIELAKTFWGLVDKYSGYQKFAEIAKKTKGKDWPKSAVPSQSPNRQKNGSNSWPGYWAHYHVPTEAEEGTKMWQALSKMMQNEFETFMNLYFKDFDDLKNNIIYADGRFKFHYYRLLWNGIGFMQKAADHLKQLYKDGERAPLVLQCKNMTFVYNNNTKLIKDSVAAVKTLTGLTDEMTA